MLHKKEFKFSVDHKNLQTEYQFLVGRQIKDLAGVPSDFELYLVVPGYEDELIEDDKTVNFARPGVERFVSRRPHSGCMLLINASPKLFDKPEISYEEVVVLAGFDPNDAQKGYTVTYNNGPRENHHGNMTLGLVVRVKDKMIFNVNATIKS